MSNRLFGSNAPSAYVAALQKNRKFNPEQIDQILRSNSIEPQLLRGDDFDNLCHARAL